MIINQDKNIRITIQYEGSRYQGWQKQDSTENTLQGKFEAILTKMAGEQVEVQASGRTDAGVHAYGQVANFHIKTQMQPIEIMAYLNRYLPEDVAVIAATEADNRFHSRLSARSKTYCYRVLNSEVPHIFERRYVYRISEQLDMQAMQRAATRLLGTHDYKAFTSTKKGKKSTVRTITKINIERIGEEIRFTYCGDGFLYHMIRILTGTLLEVGQGRMNEGHIIEIMQSGLRAQAGPLVPAQGLTLMEVSY
ncbi:MAG: tRNA pseudouridine(38-40) synthase TruA [Lachnospiraceae bacterium]